MRALAVEHRDPAGGPHAALQYVFRGADMRLLRPGKRAIGDAATAGPIEHGSGRHDHGIGGQRQHACDGRRLALANRHAKTCQLTLPPQDGVTVESRTGKPGPQRQPAAQFSLGFDQRDLA